MKEYFVSKIKDRILDVLAMLQQFPDPCSEEAIHMVAKHYNMPYEDVEYILMHYQKINA